MILAADRSGITLYPLCYPRVPPSSIPRSNPVYRLEQPLQSACTDERDQDVLESCVHHPLISYATHFRISAGLPRSSCLSIAKLFNLLFSVLLQRPSSQLYGYHIIVYQRCRAARPPAQYGARNDDECPVKRDGSVRVESCRVKLNTKLVGLGRSWLVLNMELVELQVLQLASSFSHYQYILCPYGSHISQTAIVPPRNAFSYHDVD